ncbi:MAG TPA: polyphosphate kinase 2 family protein [Steroidobacteraceae bacterium]|nr:polyphosphate kinase 2 family protein [Steroidobacteraceae bacterium]
MSVSYRRLAAKCEVEPGSHVRLGDLDPADRLSPEFAAFGGATLKERARQLLEESRVKLAKAQELLWASDSHSVLVVLQAMDAAGKDGTIKHVMSGVNPQGCEVHGFKTPSEEESDHDFLWRYAQKIPARGRIGIFNRSYYEEVLVVRVHPELLAAQRLSIVVAGRHLWKQRYDDINRFEHHLVRNGIVILKFFLNVSRAEQRRRLLDRLEDRDKRWKFSAADIAERAYWKDYMAAYQAMLRATSTKWAPWYVIPADDKYIARAVVAAILTGRIHSLGLEYPSVPKSEQRKLAAVRRRLLAGGPAPPARAR